MKTQLTLITIAASVILLSCSKTTQGPKGDTGAQGPQGPSGNASSISVYRIKATAYNVFASTYFPFNNNAITNDASVMVFFKQQGQTEWRSIPHFYGWNGKTYNMSIIQAVGGVSVSASDPNGQNFMGQANFDSLKISIIK